MKELDEMIELLGNSMIEIDYPKVREYFVKNYSDELVNRIVKINNPIIYHNFTSLMQYQLDTSIFDEKRDLFIKKMILNNVDLNEEVFNFIKNIDESNYRDSDLFTDNEKITIFSHLLKSDMSTILKEFSNKWLKEYIIYYFFHDSYFNFIVNFSYMLRYIHGANIDIIDRQHLDFYKSCYDLEKASFKDKIDFFQKFSSQKDYQSMFYDDMRLVKNHCYQNLVNSSLKIENSSKLLNKDLSREYGHPIYYLDGDKFYAITRHFNKNNGRSKEEYDKYINNDREQNYYSFSYIGDRGLYFSEIDGDGYTFLYSDIDPNNIAHIYHDDAGSSNLVRKNPFITKKYNELFTPSSLMAETKYYNEIVIKKGENGIKPSALVCYNDIRDDQLAIAKEYDIPIVLINTKKYRINNGYTDYNDFDQYDSFSL